jgi:hypothetical protein
LERKGVGVVGWVEFAREERKEWKEAAEEREVEESIDRR